MFLDFEVDIPNVPGKLVRKNRGGNTYIEYEHDRVYDPVKQYTYPKRSSIGKVNPDNPGKMIPNENFLKFFPDTDIPQMYSRTRRSPYLNIGSYVVLQKLIRDSGMLELLVEHMSTDDARFILDLACYSIVAENNAAQYYPDYAYTHPLFTTQMHMYTDSKVSDFLKKLQPQQTIGFLNDWNKGRNKRQKIYISYDSTNKNCQAGDIELVEYGKSKNDVGLPIFNYSVAFDTDNKEPLFYEEYPGSINDISQFTCMIDKAHGYGYRNLGFILDRGYFSKKNLSYMDKKGYSFLIMVKGMKPFIKDIIQKNYGTFETSRIKYIEQYDVYGTTIKKPLFEGDEEQRYIHIYYSDGRACAQKHEIKQRVKKLKNYLEKYIGKECHGFSTDIKKYFDLYYEVDKNTLKLVQENTKSVEAELSLAGYFVIVSSEKMTAKEALERYKSRDASEKLFRADKSYLGNKSMRVGTDAALSSKIFIQFLALILRSKLYVQLKEKCETMINRPNYLTVPAAIKELEKIVMIRGLDGIYRLDHAVTKTQKVILDAFGLGETNVHYRAKEISDVLLGTK